MLQPVLNEPLPPFNLPVALPQGDEIATGQWTHADLAGRPFVLFVYPRDNTSGCTIEARAFAALYPRFQELGVEVVGISRDTVRSHMGFIAKQELPYPLLADLETKLLTSWGLLVNKKMYGKPVTGVARTTYFVDGKGVVQKVWEKVSPPGHAEEALEFARRFVELQG
jgi:peroxiredoxin